MLQKKHEELEKASKYECWYLVKQPTAFDNICYLVSFLEEYKSNNNGENLQNFISKKIDALAQEKENIQISNNYRALRVAAFFGLIVMKSKKYEEATITPTFSEIKDRCEGEFENTEKYIDIIERQIEKMFISSDVDEQNTGVRQDFRLYPVMLLYKILLELGRSTGEYKVTIDEYRYLIATSKVFEDFLDTLLLIIVFRKSGEVREKFNEFREKFDNRLIQALKQLPSLEISKNEIAIKSDKVSEVAKKVFVFEENPNIFSTENYLQFLGSKKSLFDLEREQRGRATGSQLMSYAEKNETKRISAGDNILLYGVPGSGKSWTIEHEYCKPESRVERLVFHPDYTNSDFIGQILPIVDEEKQVTYDFVAGPFTTIIKDAIENPNREFILIIEEINRGNAPAIFGEVFQLLDRTTEPKSIEGVSYPIGTSEYGITHKDMAKYIYEDERQKVIIPSNLSIIGTMNTSDQNVFTLDTAFQRRWRMRLVENNFENVRESLRCAKILDTGVRWEKFCVTINTLIIGNKSKMASAEDKRLGVYFVHEDMLLDKFKIQPSDREISLYDEYIALINKERDKNITESETNRLKFLRAGLQHNREFPEKVIKYLWDDAFKFSSESLFDSSMDSLEKVIRKFIYSSGRERFKIFKDAVYSSLYSEDD